MTAGAGLQHSEMFPLLNRNGGNPLELFQIWLNLPASGKFSKPFYAMLWAENIPVYRAKDTLGKTIEIRMIAGHIAEVTAPPPAPDSWAADPANEVAIWVMKMEDHARWTIPAASPEVNRTLYFCKGSSVRVAGVEIPCCQAIDLFAEQEVIVENGDSESEFLLLQGRPINEPVVQHGPFVMNTYEEIHQAIRDYQKDQFGGWPWPRYDMVHGRDKGRFARYADGRLETR